MENLIFDINKLQCSYKDDPNRVVLDIEHLEIPKGKVVFFVGPSGIGKSTILETLGFMNNTIHLVEKFYYNGQDVSGIWSWPDEKVSSFRNKEFSFIFQQNNLMPNFTAYENVISTALIQGVTIREACKRAKNILDELDIPSNEDRPIYKYSGGQQQRLAFARAILPDFQVLFGDEPTGNLDPKSATNLANTLMRFVRERQATAIIVSHDISLATSYADIIVRILNEKEYSGNEDVPNCGHITERSIYARTNDDWSNGNHGFSAEELKNKLMEEL